jgi:Asp-tRNA(Asn)/Glu-tRNA(Gln) amidotransferase B subunit
VTDKYIQLFLAILCDVPGNVIGPIISPILINEVSPLLEKDQMSFFDIDVYHYGFDQLISECARGLYFGILQHRHVRKILRDCWSHPYVGFDLIQYALATNLLDETGGDQLVALVKQAIAANPKAIEDIRKGKDKAIGTIVGFVLKQHKADPSTIKQLINVELNL